MTTPRRDPAARQKSRALLAACVLCMLTTACGGRSSSGSPASASLHPAPLHGSVPSSTVSRPEFTLLDTARHTYDFQARTDGDVTLLYAGYTHCPDECPTTMATIATALRSVPPEIASQVTVVFVTVDPRRDTPAVLRRWLDKFHPPTPFVGLTGAPAQVDHAEIALGMPVATRKPAPKSYKSGAYAVNHFDGLLAYGHDDTLQTIYSSSVRPTVLAHDIMALVKR